MNYNFKEIEAKCQEIYFKAAEETLKRLEEEGPRYKAGNDYLLDLCGGAFLEFKDKRSAFCKQLKAFNKTRGFEWFHDGYALEIGHSGRQEAEINQSAVKAVANYLNETYKANCYARCYID